GAGQAFAVSSLDLEHPPMTPDGHIDFSQELFARITHLTVSGQLNVESYAESMSKVYTFGPTFRAENSNTTRHLSEFWMVEPEVVRGPVVLMHYPKEIKAFYIRLNDDGKTVAAMDVLTPGIGEIIGGSQREERLEILDRRILEMGLKLESYWWYRDLRRYGSVPHAGFGLGLERIIMYLSGISNIRDAI